MDRERILVVLVGVSVFLLVVVLVGMWWLSPREETPVQVVTAGEQPQQSGFDAVEWVREGEGFPGLLEGEEPLEDEFIVTETLFGSESATPSPAPVAVQAVPSPTPVRPVSRGDRAPVPAPTRTPAPRVETRAVKPTPTPVVREEFWIQIASFTSQARAAHVVEDLREKGITARIVTKTIDGVTYYRVRLGPYEKKAEAEKFLASIRSLEGYEKSYISLVYRRDP